MRTTSRVLVLLASLTFTPHVASSASRSANALTVSAVSSEPEQRARPTAEQLTELRAAVAASPELRKPRLSLIQGLLAAGDLQAAQQEAEVWRQRDAYNLVATRLLGDIQSATGQKQAARRTYSAIVELLPNDVEGRRALATVLKQAGDLEGARRELRAAVQLQQDDRRLAFELADLEQRLGALVEAEATFSAIVAANEVSEALRYPAKQRLAQILGLRRRGALERGDKGEAAKLEAAITSLGLRGGLENDIKVFLSWDTDRTDVDLWVKTPSGEKISYNHREGAHGEALFDDVTTGYGPESFTANTAQPGDYVIQVDYFSGRSGAFKEARGEVLVVLNEGRPSESRSTYPYRLYREKDVVTVARITVKGAK